VPVGAVLVSGERAVRDGEARARALSVGCAAPLGQAHASLQLVVVHGVVADHKEIVLLVALRGLVLDVPVVLSRHEVVVLLALHVVHLVLLVAGPLLAGVLGGQEVGHELLAALVHHAPDHSAAHLLLRRRRSRAHRRRVTVEDHLGARVLPHIKVWEDGQFLHGRHARLAVVLRQRLLRLGKRLLDGCQLTVPVSIGRLLNLLSLAAVAHGGLDPVVVGGLVARELRGDVLRAPQPRHVHVRVPGLLLRLRRVAVVLQQPLVVGVQRRVAGRHVRQRRGVGARLDQLDWDVQVVLRLDLVFVVLLQRCRPVFDIPVCGKRVVDVLGIEGNVWQLVGVFDPAHELLPPFPRAGSLLRAMDIIDGGPHRCPLNTTQYT